MQIKSKITFLIFLILYSSISFAQPHVVKSEETGLMYSNGKIYVVMAVVILIVAGLLLYLFNLDKKISKLEKGEK